MRDPRHVHQWSTASRPHQLRCHAQQIETASRARSLRLSLENYHARGEAAAGRGAERDTDDLRRVRLGVHRITRYVPDATATSPRERDIARVCV